MRKRGQDGKFIKNDENQEKDGFYKDLRSLLLIFYRIWRYLPILLLIWIFWKYFQVTKKVEGVILETVCGANCTCSCPGVSNSNKNSIY
jgi:hypothetical protein